MKKHCEPSFALYYRDRSPGDARWKKRLEAEPLEDARDLFSFSLRSYGEEVIGPVVERVDERGKARMEKGVPRL